MPSSVEPKTGPKTLGEIWGASLRERRESLGSPEAPLTRADVAHLADLTSQAIWLYETGQRIPRDGIKVRLARALGTTPGELFPWPDMKDLAA